jgi:ABC-2 type transport system permease protein
MRNSLTIAGRELISYFGSPVAYIVTAAFLAINGFLYGIIISQSKQADMSFVFSDMGIVLLFVIPGITMRLLAEEQRMGTIELLLTAPVRDWEVIIGKFAAAMALFLLMLVPTGLYAAFLMLWGHPDNSTIWTGYLGIILIGAVFVSIGLLMSTITQNQLVAFIVAFVISLILWLLDGLSGTFSASAGTVITYLALQQHLSDFQSGSIQSKDVVYLLSITICALFLSTRLLETRRYR